MGLKRGYEAKLYYCAAGIGGTPTWTEITTAKGVRLNSSMGEVDLTVRASGGFKMYEPTLIDLGLDFELPYDTSVTPVSVLEAAFFGRTLVGFAVMNGGVTVAGSRGAWFDGKVFKWELPEGEDSIIIASVTIKPCYSTNVPQWKEISA